MKKSCYEILGYDFIIDEDFNIWLIEVNTNPCLELSSKLLSKLIPRMLNDAMKLTIDVLFPPFNILEEFLKNSYHIEGYNDSENLWKNFVI